MTDGSGQSEYEILWNKIQQANVDMDELATKSHLLPDSPNVIHNLKNVLNIALQLSQGPPRPQKFSYSDLTTQLQLNKLHEQSDPNTVILQLLQAGKREYDRKNTERTNTWATNLRAVVGTQHDLEIYQKQLMSGQEAFNPEVVKQRQLAAQQHARNSSQPGVNPSGSASGGGGHHAAHSVSSSSSAAATPNVPTMMSPQHQTAADENIQAKLTARDSETIRTRFNQANRTSSKDPQKPDMLSIDPAAIDCIYLATQEYMRTVLERLATLVDEREDIHKRDFITQELSNPQNQLRDIEQRERDRIKAAEREAERRKAEETKARLAAKGIDQVEAKTKADLDRKMDEIKNTSSITDVNAITNRMLGGIPSVQSAKTRGLSDYAARMRQAKLQKKTAAGDVSTDAAGDGAKEDGAAGSEMSGLLPALPPPDSRIRKITVMDFVNFCEEDPLIKRKTAINYYRSLLHLDRGRTAPQSSSSSTSASVPVPVSSAVVPSSSSSLHHPLSSGPANNASSLPLSMASATGTVVGPPTSGLQPHGIQPMVNMHSYAAATGGFPRMH